ncbi:MAG TPA: hypothetical protein VH275_05280 [Solirubrobacterales bacterium]|nr:hypothetical protein [Solirubrobacterales bacterium]
MSRPRGDLAAPALVLALTLALGIALLVAPPAQAGFGISSFGAVATAEGGVPDTQAGSHPVALEMSVQLNPGPASLGQPGVPFSDGDLRDLSLEMPPGLIENPTVVPVCSQVAFHAPRQSPWEASLAGESCPDRTQLGTLTVHSSYAGGTTRTFGLFNLQPPPGAPSELGANPYGAPIVFTPRIRQAEGEYGLTLEAHDVPQLTDVSGLTLAIWGTPWSILHNAQRGDCLNEAEPGFGWAKCSPGQPSKPENTPRAYLTLPTSCEGPLAFTASADSWQGAVPVARPTQAPALAGCNQLAFEPRPFGQLNNPRASSPSGYTYEIAVDDAGVTEPKGLSPSAVRKAVVTLPDGVTINPSVGAGLGVCTPGQYEAETASSPPGAGCPNESKIGDFTVKSPIVAGTLEEGSLFLAQPYRNPFGSLLAVYLVAKSRDRGILVKVAGKLEADPDSGRLIATFDRLPQLPYSSLQIHFREGQRSPLATPPACGSYSTASDYTAWRDPNLTRHFDSTVAIAAGIGGGSCPSGTPPFAPHAAGGTLNSQAGAYSPFYLHLTRSDAEQEITSYSATLPPGLVGKIAGIPYCSDAAIEAAKRRSGIEELERPDCPAASKIGHTTAGYGVGSVLTYAPGGLYLAGPYHGSTFSVVAIDSALVGPFDLGVVIVRSAIHVDPQSAQVSIDSAGSDPIPHIIDGIPIHLRDVRVYIDRPETTLNPTSCEASTLASSLNGSGASFASPGDDSTTTATAPFQAFNCGFLGFAPKLSLRLRGATRRGHYPSLRVEARPRPGDANIAAASVALPASVFLAQNHIGTVCTRGQSAREDCPPTSIYGHARAFTPLLAQPLEGPVYLRSSDNPLPDLVVALRGGGIGIAIDLVGRVDSYKGGLRGSFEGIPDAPVSRFVMKLRGGKGGLLVNAANLCAKPQLATARFLGHANRGVAWHPKAKSKCKGGGGRRHGKHGHGKRGKGARR